MDWEMTATYEMPVEIRQARTDDIKYLIEFTESEGWDYTYFDCEASLRTDFTFLYVAVDTSGTPVGFGGISQIAPGLMYLGPYIVKESHRHKGIGRKIWKTLLKRADKSNICLDGVSAMVDWYTKQGFIYESFKIHCYVVKVTSDLIAFPLSSCDVVPLTKGVLPLLMEYDRNIYPDIDRERLLRAWFQGASVLIAFLDGHVVGYGSIHEQSKGKYGIRFLSAENMKVFETILGHMFTKLPNESIVQFALLADKPMPEYLKVNAEITGTAHRILNKDHLKVNINKLWIQSVSKF